MKTAPAVVSTAPGASAVPPSASVTVPGSIHGTLSQHRDAWSSVQRELHGIFARTDALGLQKETLVARLVHMKQLRSAAKVYFISHNVHGVLYASPNRVTAGKPLLGTVYSSFLFDPYRRPFIFDGTAKDLIALWEPEQALLVAAPFDDALAELDTLHKQANYRMNDSEQLPEARSQWARDVAALAREMETIGAQRRAVLLHNSAVVPTLAACLQRSLQPLEQSQQPTIDLFLHELTDRLRPELQHQGLAIDPIDVAASCYKLLIHTNRGPRRRDREIWPMFGLDTRTINADYTLALNLENVVRTGSPTTYNFFDVLPIDPRDLSTVTPEQRSAPIPSYRRRTRYAVQPVSHEAVRQAFRTFLLGEWYFDERLQRNVAVPADDVQNLPLYSSAVLTTHDQSVKRRALAALDQPLPAGTSKLLHAARLRQRQSILRRGAFPVFSNVSWRVQAAEVEGVQQSFCRFRQMPHGYGPRRGNCNSIVYALLTKAGSLEAGTAAKLRLPGRRWPRALGARHRLQLPCPRVL